jgi:hypothetical protein
MTALTPIDFYFSKYIKVGTNPYLSSSQAYKTISYVKADRFILPVAEAGIPVKSIGWLENLEISSD